MGGQFSNNRSNKNLKDFVRDCFEGKSSFIKELTLKLDLNPDPKRVGTAKSIMSAYNGWRPLSEDTQKTLEDIFGLKKGILNRSIISKKPAYILINIDGNIAVDLLEYLKNFEIVDEVSLVRGSIDIFVRVYGTDEQIDNFLICDLHMCENIKLRNVETLSSLTKNSFQKYPISRHQDRKTNPEKWYKKGKIPKHLK